LLGQRQQITPVADHVVQWIEVTDQEGGDTEVVVIHQRLAELTWCADQAGGVTARTGETCGATIQPEVGLWVDFRGMTMMDHADEFDGHGWSPDCGRHRR
jgi:hypothetical protein